MTVRSSAFNKMNMKKFPLILVLLCSGLILAACGSKRQATPSATMLAFCAAIQKGDAKAAVEYLDPEMCKQPEAKQKMQGLLAMGISQFEKNGGLKHTDILEEKIEGDTATLKVRYYYGNGSTEDESTGMVKRDGKWYLGMD